MSRRLFLAGVATAVASPTRAAAESNSDDLCDHIMRVSGGWNQPLFTRLLGHANAFKEGDEIIGVAAPDEAVRQAARRLLGRTRLREIAAHPPFSDRLSAALAADLEPAA